MRSSTLLNFAEARTRLAAGEASSLVLQQLASQSGDPQIEKLRSLIWQVGCSAELAIQALSEYENYIQHLSNQIEVSAKAAKLTNRITLSMPWVTALLCQWSGLNSIAGLLQTSIGWLLMLLACSLVWLANRNANRIIASELRVADDPGFDLQLAAIAIRSGLTMRKACRIFDVEEKSAAQLIAAAAEVRNRSKHLRQQRLGLLPQKLVLNTGLLVMPATLLLTLGSVLIAGLRSI